MSKGSKFAAGPPPYLKDRYRLVEWVGEGSMGVVYRAHDETLDRQVAIKFLPPGHVSGSEAGSRFLREARAVARLSHPNVMLLYNVDQEAGWFYLVLEYIPGQDLQAILAQKKGPLALDQALAVLRGSLSALGYAHSQGIIHRDIKPENIMLTPDGRIKVTDFGLAQVQGDVRLTQAGALLGTVLYLAPELIAGQPASPASDLYAIGGVLYEMLTGRPPFPGDQPTAVLVQTLNDPVTLPTRLNPAIPAAVEKIVLKLLDKEPANRFQSAEEVLAALPETVEPAVPARPVPTTTTLVERIVRSSSTAIFAPNRRTKGPICCCPTCSRPPRWRIRPLPSNRNAAAWPDCSRTASSNR